MPNLAPDTFSVAEFLEAGNALDSEVLNKRLDRESVSFRTFEEMMLKLGNQGLDPLEWINGHVPSYMQNAPFLKNMVDWPHAWDTYTTDDWLGVHAHHTLVSFTPAEFAAVCVAAETVLGNDNVWIRLDRMHRDLQQTKINPWVFLADNVTDTIANSPLLRIIIDPLSLIVWTRKKKQQSFSSGYFNEYGRIFIQAVYKAHLQLAYRSGPYQGLIILAGILSLLGKANVDISQYLAYWLGVANPVPPNVVNGPGLFSILASSSGKPYLSLCSEIGDYINTLKDPNLLHVNFINTLTTVDVAEVARERCPHCWSDFDELVPDVDTTPIKTPCGHLFMRGCLIEALRDKSLICPMCRQHIVTVLYQAFLSAEQ